MAISAMPRSDALNPPAPNRIAAQNESGSRAQMTTGVLSVTFPPLNTKTLMLTVATANAPNSIYCANLACWNQDIPLRQQITIAGTRIRLETTFVENTVQNVQ